MNYKVYKVDTLIEFGRYKGKTLLEVELEDKKYLEWLFEEIDNIKLDSKIYNHFSGYTPVYSDMLDASANDKINEGSRGYNCFYNEPYDDYSDYDIWADIAGSNDPEDINTAYWNLD